MTDDKKRNEMPPVPRDFHEASHSELVPFKSSKINIYRSPIFYFVVVTGLMSLALFNYLPEIMKLDQASLAVFQNLVWVVTGYLLIVVLLVMYLYSGTDKPFWAYLCNFAFVVALLATPIGAPYFYVFREILPGDPAMMNKEIVSHFIAMFFAAGLMEELMKVTLILVGAYIVINAQQWREKIPESIYSLISIRGPLDGLMMGLFGGAGFIFIETGGQYVAQAFQGAVQQGISGEGGLLAALMLLLPRTISGMVGHMAWAGITGYFIGLAVIRPTNALKMVALAWVGTSALHATWNTSSFVEAFSYIAVGLGGVFLVSCLLKARQLERSLGRTVDTYGSIVVQPRQPAPAQQTAPQTAPAPSAPSAPAASSSPPTSGGVIRLMFPSGPVPVVMGAQLDLAHLSADIRAEVTQHPSREDVLGLRNNGAASWAATLRDGSVQQIDAGRNIRLAPGVKIDFGGGVVAEVVG